MIVNMYRGILRFAMNFKEVTNFDDGCPNGYKM